MIKRAAFTERTIMTAHRSPRTFLLTCLALTAVMLLLALGHEQVNPWLAYNREAVMNGQLWRLISAHFVHLNLNHFLLDGAGFVLVSWFFHDVLNNRILLLWLAISAPVCGVLLLLDSQLTGYVGLSGILHGWLVIALVLGFRTGPFLHGLALLILTAKLIHEQTPFYDAGYLADTINGEVYALAHLAGALVGLLIAAGLLLHQHRQSG